MTGRRRPGLLAIVTILALATCKEPTPPSPPTPPAPGTLRLELHTPAQDDGAVMLLLRGPGIQKVTAAATGVSLYTRRADPLWKVAIVGEIRAGTILTLDVEDVNQAFSGVVLEVADRANLPRSPSDYWVRVRSTN